MTRVELVFFTGCPKVADARAVLAGAGVADFREIAQEDLPADDSRRTLSSPSLLVDGRLVVGVAGDVPSCSFETWDADTVRELTSAMAAPICSLGSTEFRERQKRVREVFRGAGPRIQAHADGHELTLTVGEEKLGPLLELLQLERQCCPSLGFVLTLTADRPGGSLRISGPPEARELLDDLLSGLK